MGVVKIYSKFLKTKEVEGKDPNTWIPAGDDDIEIHTSREFLGTGALETT